MPGGKKRKRQNIRTHTHQTLRQWMWHKPKKKR